MQGTPAFRFFSKRTQFMAQILIISSIDGEIILAEFHFTNIDDAVGSVNNHIYLRTIFLFSAFPGTHLCLHSTNTERLLDLWQMIIAKRFKGKTSPCCQLRCQQVVLPEMRIGRLSVLP